MDAVNKAGSKKKNRTIKKEIDSVDKELFSLISAWKKKYGEVVIEPDYTEEEEAEKKEAKQNDLIDSLQKQVKALEKETVRDFLQSSILSKKEINQVCDYINQGHKDSAKTVLQYTTMSLADKKRCCELIDEWPDNI